MAKLQIDLTGNKGLLSRLSQDVHKTVPEVNLRYSAKDGQMVSGIWNPLIRPGYLYPANNAPLSIEVPTISDEFFCSHSSPQTGMLFGNEDDNIYTFDNTFGAGPVYTYDKFDGVKLEVGMDADANVYDIEMYQVNGVVKLFYVTGNNVGICTPALGSKDTDWLSTQPSGGTVLNGNGRDAFLRKADNGYLYIFDDYSVHKIDGTTDGGSNGTAVMNVLKFPQGVFIIADAADTRGKMWIAINEDSSTHMERSDKVLNIGYANTAGVYLWNRQTTVFSMQDYVAVESCTRIQRIWVGPNGEIFLFTIGTSGLSEIRQYDGSKFVTIFELPFEAKPSMRDSLIVAEQSTFWAGDDGYIYCMKDSGGGQAVVKMFQFTTSSIASAGGPVLVYGMGDSFTASAGYRNARANLVVAWKPESSDGLTKKFYLYGTGVITDDNGNGGEAYITPITFVANQGDVYTGVNLLPDLSTVHSIDIRCAPTGTGSSTIATIKLYANQSTTAFSTKTVTKDEASRGYVAWELNKPYVNAIQVEVEWSTSNTMGADDFAPYVAILDYDPTITRG